ncbi:insulin-degrading enzyme-like protein, partial [Dinothrombium tinctorium]
RIMTSSDAQQWRDAIAKVHSNIVKSPNDNRAYKGLILTNGLKVLLISDPTTDKAAAALDVHVGAMSDPPSIPGLAHFLEHMLFLGTEKFPKENEYHTYISQNGGHSNAYTSSNHTNFHFDIGATHLEGALERFVEFFISPLFTESCTERELNAVNSEHEKNLKDDTWRSLQVKRATADQSHPYSKFSTGNRETLKTIPESLGIDVRKELLEFHKQWYSSNIMCLAVLGKEDIERLEEMVVKKFKNIINKSVTVPIWNQNPFGPEQLKKRIIIVPIRDSRSLRVTFTIPDLTEHYRSRPEHYVSHLVGHESAGSLLSFLKEKKLCNTLSSGARFESGFGFFDVTVDLTEEGILRTNEVVEAVFQYIYLLKNDLPQEWIFNELKNLKLIKFRFMEKELPYATVTRHSAAMQELPLEEILSGRILLQDYRPDLIKDLLERLNPENMRVIVTGKFFEGKTDQQEKWYGTHYSVQEIEEEFLIQLREVKLNENMHLPLPNEFIPTNLDLKERETHEDLPKLIKNSEITRIWFLQDNEYLVPKAFYGFCFDSPFVKIDPLYTTAVSLFTSVLRDALDEYAYNADLAGLVYYLLPNMHGIHLTVFGYDEKLRLLVLRIIEKITSMDFDEKRFEILKEKHFRSLRNFEMSPLRSLLTYHTNILLSEYYWSIEEKLAVENELTLEKLKDIMRTVFSKTKIELLAYGNIVSKEAIEIGEQIENCLKKSFLLKPVTGVHLLRNREFKLPDSSSYFFETQNEIQEDNGIYVYLQIGLQSIRETVKLHLLEHMISAHCFTILRTREQLGYIVSCASRCQNSVQGLRFLIQSNRSSAYLEDRIESFINWCVEHLSNMSDDEFENYRQGLLIKLRDKPKRLLERASEYYTELGNKQYCFDRRAMMISELEKMTKSDVLDLFYEYIKADAKKRKKLSIRIHSVHRANEIPGTDGICEKMTAETEAIKIENIDDFKSGLALFPTVKPYTNLKPKF